nr:hypothetical protein [Tanacetum cinerariifolium]GEY31439.1 hypothetical protein [Tanacetum cinerariifolium]
MYKVGRFASLKQSIFNTLRPDPLLRFFVRSMELLRTFDRMMRERLTGPNYMDWIRNLRSNLRYENKEYVLDDQIPTIDDNSTQEEIKAHQKHYDDANKVSCIIASSMTDYNQFVLSYQMNRKETSIIELYSLLQTAEQGIKKIDVPSTLAAHVLSVGQNAKKRKTSHSN